MAGDLGQRTVLAPAGDAAVHQLGIALPALVRTQAQALGNAGAETFDERVGALHHLQYQLNARWLFQINRDRTAAAIKQCVLRFHCDAKPGIDHAINAYHFGAHVREHHRAHRVGPDARQLDHLVSDQWSTRGHVALPFNRCSVVDRDLLTASCIMPRHPGDGRRAGEILLPPRGCHRLPFSARNLPPFGQVLGRAACLLPRACLFCAQISFSVQVIEVGVASFFPSWTEGTGEQGIYTEATAAVQ